MQQVVIKPLYSFPIVAVTNYHELNSLQQQRSILFHFWKPGLQNQGVRRVMLPPEALGGESAHCLLQFLGAPGLPSPACAHFAPISASISMALSSGLVLRGHLSLD